MSDSTSSSAAAAISAKKMKKRQRNNEEGSVAAAVVNGKDEAEENNNNNNNNIQVEGEGGETASKSKKESSSSSSSSTEEAPEEEESEEARKIRKEQKKKRKLEKAAAKAAAAGTKDEASVSSPSPSPSPSPNASSAAASLKKSSSSSSSNIRFNFYEEDPAITNLSSAAINTFLTTHAISLTAAASSSSSSSSSSNAIRPISAFSHLSRSLTGEQMKIVGGFEKPTPIQCACWPIILSGRDIIAIAETGSGKTLGFVLPSLVHMFAQTAPIGVTQANSQGTFAAGAAGPISLILSPTRELAQQTSVVIENAAKTLGSSLRSACVYGGIEKRLQREALRNGVHILVACPGRLLGLVEDKIISLKRVTYMVLDEADRMLDMGFEPDIRAIMGQISQVRQTMMFSATWPTVIQRLASEFIKSPMHVTIGRVDASELKANTRVKQTIHVMEEHDKNNKLLSLLSSYNSGDKNASTSHRVIVFCLYKKEVDRVSRFLSQKGWSNVVLSGDRTQADREKAIADFKAGKVGARLLIATDVAARGLDVNDVEYVINYTFPLTVEDYIHRIGRTGRAGKTGVSYTFFTKAEKHLSGELIGVLRESGETVPEELSNFGVFTKKKEHGMYGAFFKDIPEDQMNKKPTRVTFD